MARGLKRRVMVFVDYSALRDNLRKNRTFTGRAGPYAKIDFPALGHRLSGEDGEFIRLNLYTGAPVEVEDRDDGHFMHGLQVRDHEAHRARLVQRTYDDLVRYVNELPYTELHSGRMILQRVEFKHGPAFQWVQSLLSVIGTDANIDDIFSRAVSTNSEAKISREELSRMVIELKDQGRIPSSMMPAFTSRISQLMDESLDFTEKGVDTMLTVQMLEHCMNDSFDDAVLFAADEDYIPLVEAVKRTGRRVIHAFWDVPNSGWPLQRVCDSSILLGEADFKALLYSS